MNHLVEEKGLSESIISDSAGTSSYHIGSLPDRRMNAAATQKLGITLKGRARQLDKSDLRDFDLILAMDKENYANILSLDRSGEYGDKVRLMCDFCSHHTLKEVPDPYYGGNEGFNSVIDLLVDACEGLLNQVGSDKIHS